MASGMLNRRAWTRAALVVAVAGVVVLLRATLFAPEVIPVRVVAVGKGRVEETVTNSRAGTVKARRRAKLAPEIGGRVLSLPRRRGARVRQGDLLLRVDDSLQRARLRLAEDEQKTAAAQREQACLVAERAGREAESEARVDVLRALLWEVVDALGASPRRARLRRALHHTYLEPAGSQERVAEQLELPLTTYRDHLRAGLRLVGEILWQREAGAADGPGPDPVAAPARPMALTSL